jgi:glutamyl-Q tRNA(Asp) synthetase
MIRATYVGRFAPSPTGPLHFGSLVAAVASFLDARAAGGRWLVRIEDVDTTRSIPGAAEGILRTLASLGLEWDGEVAVQSERSALYESALERLRAAGLTYACKCSRRELADSGLAGVEGAIYPGTCRELHLPFGTNVAERLRAPAQVGDFVLKRRDGLHAYQLAVGVDDAHQGVTDVVRGAARLWSTPRQVALQRALGLPTPRYLHVPVATNARGEKLSKQTRAPAIDPARAMHELAAVLDFLGQPPAEGSTPGAILEAAARRWNATFGDRTGAGTGL